MKVSFAMLFAVLTLTGCAGRGYWAKGGDIRVDSSRDLAQCDYEASAATANIRNGFEAGYMLNELTRKCMRARGYEWVIVRPDVTKTTSTP